MKPEDFEIILWDFDGVIINSNAERERGFREVLKTYPKEQVEKLIEFHNINGGWSRYVKFRYFFESIRKEEVSDEEVNKLAQEFSEIMLRLLVDKELLIDETLRFISRQFALGKEMHIVSGSDQTELRKLCEKLEIVHYFYSVLGSPTPKKDLVASIIKESTKPKDDYCLIGDAINDYDAAIDNNIQFFGFNNKELLKRSDSYIFTYESK